MAARRPSPPVVLLTGFAPFGGDAGNPSREIAFALHGRRVAGHRIVARELPVVFGGSLRTLRRHVRALRPALVVCLGLAGGRERISLERIAINVDDARIPDNAGAQPVDAPVVPGGPPAYFTTLPIKAMLAALQAADVPAEVSQTAGTFVCNHVFYGLMHALRARPAVRGGFVHVPGDSARPADAGQARGLPLPVMVEGVRIAIRSALTTGDDARIAAGAIE